MFLSMLLVRKTKATELEAKNAEMVKVQTIPNPSVPSLIASSRDFSKCSYES